MKELPEGTKLNFRVSFFYQFEYQEPRIIGDVIEKETDKTVALTESVTFLERNNLRAYYKILKKNQDSKLVNPSVEGALERFVEIQEDMIKSHKKELENMEKAVAFAKEKLAIKKSGEKITVYIHKKEDIKPIEGEIII